MTSEAASAQLKYILEQNAAKLRKPKSSVLFRRGDRAYGVFIVLSGKVRLDLGVDSLQARSYSVGTLLGLPSAITRQPYSMTATVMEDAELGFLSPDGLDALLHNYPSLYEPLLVILGEKVAESRDDERTVLKQVASHCNA